MTIGSITRSRVYGCSFEPGGEVGVTGWWQQMVDGTGLIMHFSKEISRETMERQRHRQKHGS